MDVHDDQTTLGRLTDTPAPDGHVWVFLYGGLMHPQVMASVGLVPRRQALASLDGWEITIAPLVNLAPARHATAYGVAAEVQHGMLADAYGRLAVRYHPTPVLIRHADGALRPVLCFVVPDMAVGPAHADHVRPLLDSARAFGFPRWYVERIEGFLPGGV